MSLLVRLPWARSLFLLAAFSATGQQTSDLVLHIDVNLVQVDAVVYDRKGHPVTDLRPEDFEILEDGKPQPITNFSYVHINDGRPARPPLDRNSPAAPKLPQPIERLKREQVRHTIALIADDLNLSFESVAHVRRSLHKFVESQMGPDDLVSVARTSTGLGMLQSFTNDKRELFAAIDSLHWNPNGAAGIGVFAPVTPVVRLPGRGGDPPPDDSPARPQLDPDQSASTAIYGRHNQQELYDQEHRRYEYARGALGSLTSIIKGLGEMPGRKAIILFSDGVPLPLVGDELDDSRRFLNFVADAANRSSVVLNCVDARGLVSTSLTAQDNPGEESAARIETNRRETFNESQEGLIFLAHQTGGRAILNGNDLSWAIDRVMDDLSGYYLLGYKPQPGTFHKVGESTRFHHLVIRLNRPGLEIRSRKGFFNVTDREARPLPATLADQLHAALTSPFGASEIPLQLTCEFQSDGTRHAEIVTMLRIDARNITFETQPDGLYHATLALLVTGHDQDGRPVETTSHIIQAGLTEAQHRTALEAGLVFTEIVPVSRSGSAHVRAAVRDMPSGRVGATSEFVLLPDLKKKRLAVTTLIVGDTGKASSLDHAAVRIFKPGQPVPYRFNLFNPKLEHGDPFARVETQVRLFHGGELVWSGLPSRKESRVGHGSNELMVKGSLQLGPASTPGDYYLQVIATDLQAGKKSLPATQWINFELVR